jgi:peroxiredoxin
VSMPEQTSQAEGISSLPQPPGASRRRSLFLWVLVALSILVLGVGVAEWRAGSRTVTPHSTTSSGNGRIAPDFHLKAADGTSMRLSDLRGQVVLLNFWATWCPPCKAEMPDLNGLNRDYGPGHRFTVVGVDLEENPEAVASFAREQEISFPLLLDADGSVTRERYRLRALPTSMIIDREGKVRDTWSGQLPRAAMLERLSKIW